MTSSKIKSRLQKSYGQRQSLKFSVPLRLDNKYSRIKWNGKTRNDKYYKKLS